MSRPHDETRRNRNIGTSKSGHGRNNRLVLSVANRDARSYYECLTSYNVTRRTINQVTIVFIVEKTRAQSFHACTVDDIAYLLNHVPPADLSGIELVVLRQPKRKEEIIDSRNNKSYSTLSHLVA